MVHIKTVRLVPKVPAFPLPFKPDEEDTEESNVSQPTLKSALSHH
jgi:hypothetical protein